MPGECQESIAHAAPSSDQPFTPNLDRTGRGRGVRGTERVVQSSSSGRVETAENTDACMPLAPASHYPRAALSSCDHRTAKQVERGEEGRHTSIRSFHSVFNLSLPSDKSICNFPWRFKANARDAHAVHGSVCAGTARTLSAPRSPHRGHAFSSATATEINPSPGERFP
ncbi:hypothetical protein NDU88_011001 [Pleurodeles waltl]|uniref:Uncharacterized protein n=1 Tax=Pleurodeles waltl TaxID=8319 RepID=A0AAV7QVY9_PLEWA|nr:hypothetical protein NDU88_011001 [Pleurodeles waltl]